MEKIISVVFKVESEGYQAMTELKQNPITDSYTVSTAVLVKKENNEIKALDVFDSGIETRNNTWIGGLVGGLIGILGGPLGVLLGGGYGALLGSTIDMGDSVHNMSLIEKVSEQLVDGEIVLIALEQEATEGAIQKMLTKFDVSIIEEDAANVAEEVEQAVEAQKEMERQARAKLRAAKKEEYKQKIEEQRTKLKAEFEDFKAKFKK